LLNAHSISNNFVRSLTIGLSWNNIVNPIELSANAQTAASSNKNTEVISVVAVLVAVISKTLKAIHAKLLLKSSSSFNFKISEVKRPPSHALSACLVVFHLLATNKAIASF
jgi:hypothetical protein